MSVDVTIVTATIPGREELLARAIASVRNQTLMPSAHIYKLDDKRAGGAVTKNSLMNIVNTEWVIILDDDDALLPNHIETLWAQRDKADIIYSYATGDSRYNRPFSTENLMIDSIVSHTAMFRISMFQQLGGFKIVQGYDHELWKDAATAGFTFLSIPEKTSNYDLDEARPHESLGGLRWEGC